MREAKIVVRVIQSELLAQPGLVFAQGGDPSPDGGHMLADREIDALHEGRVDLPAADRQHLGDGLERPEDHAVRHADQAPPAHGLDDLSIQRGWGRGIQRGWGRGPWA